MNSNLKSRWMLSNLSQLQLKTVMFVLQEGDDNRQASIGITYEVASSCPDAIPDIVNWYQDVSARDATYAQLFAGKTDADKKKICRSFLTFMEKRITDDHIANLLGHLFKEMLAVLLPAHHSVQASMLSPRWSCPL